MFSRPIRPHFWLVVIAATTFLTDASDAANFRGVRGSATVIRTNGFVIRGNLLSISSTQVRIRAGGRLLELKAYNVKTVHVGGDTYNYHRTKRTFESARALAAKAQKQRITAEAGRSGRIQIVNNTSKAVEFVITRLYDPEGNERVLGDGRTKTNLEDIAGMLDTILNDGKSKASKPMRWNIKPRKTAYLKSGGDHVVTSKVHYSLITSDGSKEGTTEKNSTEDDFVITIDDSDLHSPVLVNMGRWNLEQDISYTTQRARTPTTIHPVKGFFSGKIQYYEVLGGEEYEYTKETRSGYATAWAEIENPTHKTLHVTAAVEFHFTHLLLSHERVNASITVQPKTKTKMYITVNTLALVGNRKAISVRQIDVTTTEK